MFLYTIDNPTSFNPDPDLFETNEQQLTADDVEERMDAILRAWNWNEEKRDDALYSFDDDDKLDWEADTETAYSLAVSAPSGTPFTVFTALLEARGWPRTDQF